MASRLDTFHPFPELPIELRTKIWDEAALVPRIVKIGVIETEENLHQRRITYKTRTPVPALLRANQESRKQGLKYYSLSFGSTSDYIDMKLDTIYINFKVDLVYFPVKNSISSTGMRPVYSLEHLLYSKVSPSESKVYKKITRLAIDIGHADQEFLSRSAGHIVNLPNLRELVIVDSDKPLRDLDSDDEEDRISQRKLRTHPGDVFLADPEIDDMAELQAYVERFKTSISKAAVKQSLLHFAFDRERLEIPL